MDYSNILFGLFSIGAILSAMMVIIAINPVHAVFFLILVFSFSSGLILMLNVEFLAIIFLIVYVGAIAVLFLFVVMMLNIKYIELQESIVRYLPISSIVGLIFIIELFYILQKNFVNGVYSKDELKIWIDKLDGVSNLSSLGEVLYTYYVYYFMLAGLILLVAMIGCIVLTLHHYKNVKRQDVYKQVGRLYNETVINKKFKV